MDVIVAQPQIPLSSAHRKNKSPWNLSRPPEWALSVFTRLRMTHFTKTVLFTDTDGRARFREETIPLLNGTAQTMLSDVFASGGYQLRTSPVGFRSTFHCTGAPQWVFILAGLMEIGLQGGESRVFSPGHHFFSADVLPEGVAFDAAVHGHWSRQVGDVPLVTLFVRA
jgi:hypothetical protein